MSKYIKVMIAILLGFGLFIGVTACNGTTSSSTISPHVHDYQFSSLEWIEEGKSAEATLVCSLDSTHIIKESATITSSVNEPTEAGNYWHYVDDVPTIW